MASYGYLPVPLVYTQVVHLAVYVYFAASLVGEQWIIWKQEGDEEVDLYYPVFMSVRSILILLKFILKQSFIRFLFVFGWLRERLDYNEKSWK